MNRAEFSLDQWLSWMEQNHPVLIDLGLDRVRKVFESLSLDFTGIQLITVAGTNGKGTTLAYLDSIFQEAGYTTLCYTSPHLELYNERVRLCGTMVEDGVLVDAFQAIDRARGEISLTYFEMGTLAALWILDQYRPDVALLEVGLGGRLDAINVVDADIAVVTTIDIDHIEWLGDDREQIGREKAGIFRANAPAVCGELLPPASIQAYADELGTPLYQLNQVFSYQKSDESWCWQGQTLAGNTRIIEDLPLPRLPLQNAATALQVIQLSGLSCDADAIKRGVANASVAGRMDTFTHKDRRFILDVAHNPQSAQYLAAHLSQEQGPVQLILGMLADKDCQQVMVSLSSVVDQWHLVTLDVPRGQTAEALKGRLPQEVESHQVCCYGSVEKAISCLLDDTPQGENSGVIVVAGSFFTVGAAYRALNREIK